MNNPIVDMRERLRDQLSRGKPKQGFGVSSVFRPTANDMPRSPQSSIPNVRPRYDSPGRPAKSTKPTPLFRKKPKDIWGGWL